MMKRGILLAVCLAILLSLLPVGASATEMVEIQDLPDGGCLEIKTVILDYRASGTKTAKREMTSKNANGDVQWKITLTGTFSYDGITAKATNAQVAVQIQNTTNWSLSSKYAYTTGAVAKADVALIHKVSGSVIDQPSYSLTLTCDPDGNIF